MASATHEVRIGMPRWFIDGSALFLKILIERMMCFGIKWGDVFTYGPFYIGITFAPFKR